MDLDYLLLRHQISLANALSAPRSDARCAHRGLAKGYERRISVLRAQMSAQASDLPCPLTTKEK